jgi:hypothetical protein
LRTISGGLNGYRSQFAAAVVLERYRTAFRPALKAVDRAAVGADVEATARDGGPCRYHRPHGSTAFVRRSIDGRYDFAAAGNGRPGNDDRGAAVNTEQRPLGLMDTGFVGSPLRSGMVFGDFHESQLAAAAVNNASRHRSDGGRTELAFEQTGGERERPNRRYKLSPAATVCVPPTWPLACRW